jgi:hypothetical protein
MIPVTNLYFECHVLKASPGVALLWFYFAIMLLFAGLILALSILKCQKDAIKRKRLKNDDSTTGSLPKQQGDAVLPKKEEEGNKYFRNEVIVGFAHNLERSSSSQYLHQQHHDDQTTANNSFFDNNNGDDDGEEFKNDDDYIV